jgi:putative transposase
MNATAELSQSVGTAAACQALNVPRASFYRWQRPPSQQPPKPRKPSPRKLSAQERQEALDLLHSPEFVDQPPAQVVAAKLDEGEYICSTRTMYRLLAEEDEVRERRNQLRHPNYKKPELLATGPNQVWSWDITKLLGPAKWSYYYLYVILDIFSRYVVGWMVASREGADLAQRLIRETVAKHEIDPDGLTLHSDRGSAMKSHNVAQLLGTLGVTKSHSRPHVSNDNPFSESQFKTLKYRPEFPDRFGSLEDALAFCREFFAWYNDEHYHSGLAMLTPAMVHYGTASLVLEERQRVLDAAYAAHPERFVKAPPVPKPVPTAVWINPPQASATQPVSGSTATTLNREEPAIAVLQPPFPSEQRDTNFVPQVSQTY